jgi:signal transduction histidine kinase
VIVMQAGGAGSVPRLGEADAKAALGTIEQTGRQAFAEMRRLVGVLRDDSQAAAIAPQPTIGEIPALLARLADSGLRADLQVEGEPRPVPAGVALSAYRIVQEALTNTLKHAGAARARVRLVWSADRLEIEVTDDGPAAGVTARAQGCPDSGGHGLVGMRERVVLYGGDLDAGPAADGAGYRVVARLPLGGAV